jgi:hypothetical protein
MKKKIAKIIGAAALVLAAITLTQTARAGFGGYSPYNITNQTVTAPVFVTNYVYVSLPSVSFTAVATNTLTITTNSIIQGLPGTTYQNIFTFVYNSGTMGTNFSTNFPAYSFAATNITGFQSVPQSQGNSNMVQETFN